MMALSGLGAGAVHPINGKFRDECLSLEWFRSRAEAKVVIEVWRRHYNEVRPHSSLGYLTPAVFTARLKEHLPLPQRARALRDIGDFAPQPVAPSSLKGQDDSQETPALST